MASSGNSTTPFFGCKISLISKSEIRYEGILYTIDPKESTIALAKVRSFGSEDRPVERPVPPRDDIFEFIIFRASDIKDLIVDDPPPAPTLTDPAIIQAHSTSTSFPSSFPQSSISANGPAAAGPAAVAPQATQQPQQNALQQLQATSKGSGAVPKQQQQHSAAGNETRTDSSKPKPSLNVSSGQAFARVAAGNTGAADASAGQQKQPRQQNLQYVNKQSQQNKNVEGQQQQPSGLLRTNQQQQQQSQSQGQNGYVPRQQQQRQNNPPQNRVIGENANPNYHRNGPNIGGQQQQQQQQGFRPFNSNRFAPRHGGQQQQMGGPGGFRTRGSFGGHPGGMQHRNFISHNRGPQAHQNGPKFPPLPDGDFDFEKAQADFKILEEKLSALKLNGVVSGSVDGDAVDSLPEVPGIPASALTVAALEQEDISKEPCYNKTKSFFDSISCEALEREKGANQRVDWKAERKQNRETFGVVSARRPTFYRVNNRGGFGGGSYRGGYHQQRGHQHYNQHYQHRQNNNQDRNPMNRVPRTPNSNGLGNNNVSSTTPNNPNSRTPKTPNGVGSAAPVAIATKN